MTIVRRSAATAGALAAFAAPLAAIAATVTTSQPQTYQMETRLFDRYGAGQYDGVMRLTVYPSGIVSGWYRDADNARLRTVTGGIERDGRIWLTVGGRRALHLNGTFRNGVLKATASIPGPHRYEFESTSSKKV